MPSELWKQRNVSVKQAQMRRYLQITVWGQRILPLCRTLPRYSIRRCDKHQGQKLAGAGSPLRPFSVFLMFGICLCTMNGSFGVLRRRVNGGKHQGAVPSIQNIVPCSTRHEHSISRAEVVTNIQVFPARSHTDKSLSAFHADELIRVRMHFHADVAAGRDVYQGHLQMMSCPKRAAEIMVMPRRARNIHNKWIAPVIDLTAVFHWMM